MRAAPTPVSTSAHPNPCRHQPGPGAPGPRPRHPQHRGSAGHPVALISRNAEKLRGLADDLAAVGTIARAYPADVTDAKTLTDALEAAAEELGRIGVLSYSPAPTLPNVAGQVPDLKALGFTAAAETTPESVRPMFDMLVGGALTAAAAVPPGMREARRQAFQRPGHHPRASGPRLGEPDYPALPRRMLRRRGTLPEPGHPAVVLLDMEELEALHYNRHVTLPTVLAEWHASDYREASLRSFLVLRYGGEYIGRTPDLEAALRDTTDVITERLGYPQHLPGPKAQSGPQAVPD
ncbi:SDR family NAD(P)-dependent oxidoreductase [Streptomyces mirabilis]|uniref:SDR family NAD(P)-dependent oxidoreductase n=1 Tax=Streptomyces mirabilis TaxID=68239 RepID=UPI00368D120E